MAGKSSSFGELVRREREAKKLGLREMAKQIGVSATYLCKIELGDSDPPTEDRVRKIAELIDRDPDDLLALAGRVPSELADIILESPRESADLLRTLKNCQDTLKNLHDEITRFAEQTRHELERVTQKAKERQRQRTDNPVNAANKDLPHDEVTRFAELVTHGLERVVQKAKGKQRTDNPREPANDEGETVVKTSKARLHNA
jgi:transcriptional regulator with XRE-family HTH domain